MRLIIRLFILSVIFSTTIFANAFIINNETNAKIQQTHHLAVIKISENRADLAVYVNFTGIPAGKKVTYILPFMYKPENFKIAESSSMGFYADYIDDVDKQINVQNDITSGTGSKILQKAWTLPLSIPIMTKREFWVKDEEEFINPYQNEKTTNFKANLNKIVVYDKNEFIDKSNFVYNQDSPYYAIITLTGLANTPIQGRGFVFNFSHNLEGNQYQYPLWVYKSAKIPIMTDIYLTSKDNIVMSVYAPSKFKKVTNNQLFKVAANYFTNDLANINTEITSIQQPLTQSVCHIAYFMAKPKQYITVCTQNRRSIWQYQFAKDLTDKSYAVLIVLLITFISWLVTIPLLIKPHCKDFPDKSFLKEIFIPYLIILAYYMPINAVIITFMAEPFYGFMLAIVFIIARCSSVFTGDNPAPPVAKRILLRLDLPFPREEKILAGKCWLLSTGLFIISTRILYALVHRVL